MFRRITARDSRNRRTLTLESLENRQMLDAAGVGLDPSDHTPLDASDTWLFENAASYSVSQSILEDVSVSVSSGVLSESDPAQSIPELNEHEKFAFELMWENIEVSESSFDADSESVLAENAMRTTAPTVKNLAFSDLGLNEDLVGKDLLTSGGSGGDDGSGGSGGSGGYSVAAYISGGLPCVREGFSVTVCFEYAHPGDVLELSLSGVGSSPEDVDLARSKLIATADSYGNGSFKIYTIKDNLTEGDELLILTLNVLQSNYGTVIAPSSVSLVVAITETPEFVSDFDYPVINSDLPDLYSAYVRPDAVAGTAISLRNKIMARGENLLYGIIGYWENQCFEIDQTTGDISLRVSAEDLIAMEHIMTSLQIVVYDKRYPMQSSLLSESYDLATVSVCVSVWQVDRAKNQTASAIPLAGCTIADLAQDIGLEPDEYLNWLTINPEDDILLFDGTVKTAKDLTAADVLDAGAGSFAVPNTIFMAWCDNGGSQAKSDTMWSKNVECMKALGFNVEVFDNDSYAPSNYVNAMVPFAEKINSLSKTKCLHGMCLIGLNSSDDTGSYVTGKFDALGWSINIGSLSAIRLMENIRLELF